MRRLGRVSRAAAPHGLSFRSVAPRRLKLDLPVSAFSKRHPVVFGSVLAALKTGGADYFVQRCFEERDHADVQWARVAAFTLFGAGYLGCVQYFVYVRAFTRVLFPRAKAFLDMPVRARLRDARGLRDSLGQVALDSFVHAPFMYFPAFYACKGAVEARGAPGCIDAGIAKWRANLWDDMLEYWKVWSPAQLVNFTLLPGHMRIPFIAAVSLFWTVLLSLARGDDGQGRAHGGGGGASAGGGGGADAVVPVVPVVPAVPAGKAGKAPEAGC